MRAADDDTPSLPEDPAALRALLLETRALSRRRWPPSAMRWRAGTSGSSTCC